MPQTFTHEQGKLIRDLAKLEKAVKLGREKKEKEALKSEMRQEFDKKFEALKDSGLESEKYEPTGKFEYVEDDNGEPEESMHPIQKMVVTPPEEQESVELAKKVQKKQDMALIEAAVNKIHPARTSTFKQLTGGKSRISKALDSHIEGAGAEWRPTVMSADFIENMHSKYEFAQLFDHLPIKSGTGKLELPGGEGNIVFYRRSASSDNDIAAVTASDPSTYNVIFNPEELSGRVQYDQSMYEDSPVTFLEWLREQAIIAASKTVDVVCMNGDTNWNNPMDSNLNNSADARTCWDGVRKLTIDDAKIDCSDTISLETFRQLWVAMETEEYDYSNPKQLALVVNRVGWLRYLVIAELLTREKFGANASILTGEIPDIFKVPPVETAAVPRNLNASGVYDGSTTNYTIAQLVNHRSYAFGDKREITVESTKNIKTGRYDLVITLRLDFQQLYPTTQPCTATMYGIDKTT